MFESDIEKVLLTANDIQKRTEEMGAAITRDYSGKEIVLAGILNGAVNFFAALACAIQLPVYYDFMQVSSYGQSATSSGNIKVKKDLNRDIAGQEVILVEDIVDTGYTLTHVKKMLGERKPASIRIASLLDKKVCRKVPLDVDYVGFTVADEFLVGHGLDYAQKYRNLPYIGILKREIYA
jgi:hypoxanthine phosphoribosyltransferase